MPIPVDNTELLELYDSGKSLQAIADIYGVEKQAVHERLKRVGYSPRPNMPRVTFERKQLIDLYVTQDLSLGQVAKHLNTSPSTITDALKLHGIDVRRRGTRDKYRPYFDKLTKIGDSVLIPCTYKYKGNPHPPLQRVAKRLGLKVSIKKAGEGYMRVTRKSS